MCFCPIWDLGLSVLFLEDTINNSFLNLCLITVKNKEALENTFVLHRKGYYDIPKSDGSTIFPHVPSFNVSTMEFENPGASDICNAIQCPNLPIIVFVFEDFLLWMFAKQFFVASPDI